MEDDVEIVDELVNIENNPRGNGLQCPLCLDNSYHSLTGLNVHLDVVHNKDPKLADKKHLNPKDIKHLVEQSETKCSNTNGRLTGGLPGPATNGVRRKVESEFQDQLVARRLEQQEKFRAGRSPGGPKSPVRKKFETDEEIARRLANEDLDYEAAVSLQREEEQQISEVVILDQFQSDDIQEINAVDVEATLNGPSREASPLAVSVPERMIDESIVNTLPEYNLADERIRRRIFTNPDTEPGICCTFDVLKTIRANVRLDRRTQDVYLCTDCGHFASDSEDYGFSCGYRNAQVLMSCMYNFRALKNQLVRKLGDMYVPSIEKIQRLIEKGWREGWDPQGAIEHNFRLHGSRRWIGPVDLYAMFMSMGIEVQIDYFVHDHANYGPHPQLFEYARKHFVASATAPVFPLYLQHAGHSQTIVGYELKQESKDCNLLVFDPAVTSEKMRYTSGSETRWLDQTVRRPSNKLSKPSYEVLVVTGRVLSPQDQARAKAAASSGITGRRFVS